MDQDILKALKKYGVIGLILAYFLYQDNHNRELDRQDRKNNIKVMETLAEKVGDLNTRMTVMEVRLEKLSGGK